MEPLTLLIALACLLVGFWLLPYVIALCVCVLGAVVSVIVGGIALVSGAWSMLWELIDG